MWHVCASCTSFTPKIILVKYVSSPILRHKTIEIESEKQVSNRYVQEHSRIEKESRT